MSIPAGGSPRQRKRRRYYGSQKDRKENNEEEDDREEEDRHQAQDLETQMRNRGPRPSFFFHSLRSETSTHFQIISWQQGDAKNVPGRKRGSCQQSHDDEAAEKPCGGSSAVHEKGRVNVRRKESQGDIRESGPRVKTSSKTPVRNALSQTYH